MKRFFPHCPKCGGLVIRDRRLEIWTCAPCESRFGEAVLNDGDLPAYGGTFGKYEARRQHIRFVVERRDDADRCLHALKRFHKSERRALKIAEASREQIQEWASLGMRLTWHGMYALAERGRFDEIALAFEAVLRQCGVVDLHFAYEEFAIDDRFSDCHNQSHGLLRRILIDHLMLELDKRDDAVSAYDLPQMQAVRKRRSILKGFETSTELLADVDAALKVRELAALRETLETVGDLEPTKARPRL